VQRNVPKKHAPEKPDFPVRSGFSGSAELTEPCPVQKPALLVPKNPPERGAFQRGSIQTINTPGATILLPDSNDIQYDRKRWKFSRGVSFFVLVNMYCIYDIFYILFRV